MPRPRIPAAVRRAVIRRAFNRCEYCLLPADWVSIPHHIDHIIPLKHNGQTVEENLAYACFDCNVAKGSDIAAFDPLTGEMTRLFDPRRDSWAVHFRLANSEITGRNAAGRATTNLLRLNEPLRVRQRALLIAGKVYAP